MFGRVKSSKELAKSLDKSFISFKVLKFSKAEEVRVENQVQYSKKLS